MSNFIDNIINNILVSYQGYAQHLWQEIIHPSWHSYFYVLTFVSALFWLMEIYRPWRLGQSIVRKDFWLDIFYMYFNFFIFSLIIYQAGSEVVVHLVQEHILLPFNIDLVVWQPLQHWPLYLVFIVGFVIRDFIQWWTHRLLHFVPFLWSFHQIHHSVKEMGFAAHLRYHWMETIVYRTIEYLPLALLGLGLYDFFIIHVFSLIVGHFNHSNLTVDKRVTGGLFGLFIGLLIGTGSWEINLIPSPTWYIALLGSALGGILGFFIFSRGIKYVFNSPEMHIWHHAKELPTARRFGINFGLSLAIWDYLFRTAYIPHDGRDIELGFPGDNPFPTTFWKQIRHGIGWSK